MNKNMLRNRIKFFQSSSRKIIESKPINVSRREENYVDTSDIENSDFSSDFFEFEKELSELKASKDLKEN